MLGVHALRKPAATVAVHRVDDVRSSGAVTLDGGDRITGFAEKRPGPSAVAGWVNAGVYLLEEAAVAAIPVDGPSDFGFDVFPKLLADDVYVGAYRLSATEAIYPIDTPELYNRAAASLASP
jgi:NDP-sugar pyrophosphorylase family protein